jgi:3-hydroxyacyl-CoA dehydrogenase
VVRAKDTPNFIANRVGIAGMLATMKEVENFGLTYDVVDDLTGKKLGRASSGTFRTADVVGLDTMAHVIKTLQDNLSRDRPVLRQLWHARGAGDPDGMGNLGQKTKAGFYKKVGRDMLRFDLAARTMCPVARRPTRWYGRMLKKPR